MLYSAELPTNVKHLSEEVQKCIAEIKDYFKLKEVKVLEYQNNTVVVPVEISVSIPPRGTVGGIDIRSIEPILIQIFLNSQPFVMPYALSDRKDFPKASLSHLYVAKEGEPSALCLVRNNRNEWFANKTTSDFLFIVEEWFFKAAAGLLNEDGGEFDPMRLDAYRGFHVYKYDSLFQVVNSNQACLKDNSFAILFGSVGNKSIVGSSEITYRSFQALPYLQIEPMIKTLVSAGKNIDLTNATEKPIFSLLVWPPTFQSDSNYWTDLPKYYKDLRKIFNDRGINIDGIVDFYCKHNLQRVNGIPITLAIKRPKKMIGFNGDIEFVNFGIAGANIKSGKIPDDAEVFNLNHIEPFSPELAMVVSGQQRNKEILFVGAGSLGSKMIMHEIRSGNFNISVVDDDKFLQHNLARHALFNNRVGENKAKAILEEAKGFLSIENHAKLKPYDKKVHSLTTEELKGVEWIIDTTASFNVQNWVSKTDLLDSKSVVRSELADEGKLGLTYIEGVNRNPRIDDLVNLTHYKALEINAIEEWRLNDSERELTNLDIGLGCSSTTAITSDDTISFHAALFSQVFYNEYSRKNIGSNGLIFVSELNNKLGLINTSTHNILVAPFLVLPCANGSMWEVRIAGAVDKKIFTLVKAAGKNETGGVLVGIANYKTRTIHVLDIIKAPVDSKGTPGRFTRGIKNLPETINDIKARTGNMIGYIGEWHSHPMGLEELSTIDLKNIEILKKENHKVPIPTCAVIVSNEKIIPFIFE